MNGDSLAGEDVNRSIRLDRSRFSGETATETIPTPSVGAINDSRREVSLNNGPELLLSNTNKGLFMNADSQVPALVCGEIGLVRSLGEIGIPVYVGSYYDDNIAYFSKYCRQRIHFTHSLSRDFVDRLIELGKSTGRKMAFFSDDDRAVLTFSQYRHELEPYYYFNLPPVEMVNAILDKGKFAVLAEQYDLPVPRSFKPESVEELRSNASALGFPCIIKPAQKDDWWNPRFKEIVGSYKKAILCDSMEMLIDVYGKVTLINPTVILQEYVEGDDNDLYSINLYLDAKSNCKASFIGHKLRVYPIHAGVGSLVETVRDDELEALAIAVTKKLRLQGHVNIQFKRDRRTRQLKIMEMHTRNSLWAYLATGSGLNITAIAYYDMLGLDCPLEHHLRYGVKWIDLNKDVKALLDYRKSGEWTIPKWIRSYAGKKVFHVHSLKDPRPFIADSWFVAKRYFSHNHKQGAAPHA